MLFGFGGSKVQLGSPEIRHQMQAMSQVRSDGYFLSLLYAITTLSKRWALKVICGHYLVKYRKQFVHSQVRNDGCLLHIFYRFAIFFERTMAFGIGLRSFEVTEG